MADNSEEFDFAAASKAELNKAKENQKKQKKTSFEEEVDAYLVEKYPLDYVEDASGKRQYNPESNRYRAEARPKAEQTVARKRAQEKAEQYLRSPDTPPELIKAHNLIQSEVSKGQTINLKDSARSYIPGVDPPPPADKPWAIWGIVEKRQREYYEDDYGVLGPNTGLGYKRGEEDIYGWIEPEAADGGYAYPIPDKKRKKRKKKPKPVLGVEFNEQSFLWDYIDLFPNFQNAGQEARDNLSTISSVFEDADPSWNKHAKPSQLASVDEPYRYKNFIQLTSDEPGTTNNKLWGYGSDSLNDLTTAQLSSLIPFIRIYKLVESEDGKPVQVDFPFNKFTTMQSILDSKENRGTDAGLIGIDWEDVGGNPAQSGLIFKGQMQLRFQSLEGIFKKRMVDNHEIAFGDLLYLKGALGKEADKEVINEDNELEPNRNCPNVIESINMEIGWTIPDSPELNLDKNNLKEALRKMRRTYSLYISNQEIDITENGDVGLRVDFTAAILGRTLSTMADLLRIDANNEDPSKKIESQIIGESRRALIHGEELIKDEFTPDQSENPSRKKNKNELKKAQDSLKKAQEVVKTLRSNLASASYARLFAYIMDGGVEQGGVSRRVKGVRLSEATIGRYKRTLEMAADYKDLSLKDAEGHKQFVAEAKQQLKLDLMSDGVGFAEDDVDPAQIPDKSPIPNFSGKGKKRKIENYNPSLTPKVDQTSDSDYVIHYVFLGDIIEAAMGMLYDPRIVDQSGKLGEKEKGRCPIVKNAIRLLMGPCSVTNSLTGKVKKVDMADFPVSLSYFKAWWYNNTIGKKRTTYYLNNFLEDLCKSLLNNVFSPARHGGFIGKAPKFQITPYTAPASHPLNKEWKKLKDKEKRRMNINDFMPGGRAQFIPGLSTEWSDWIYVYCQGVKSGRTKNFNGNIEDDANIYLPHFFTGANKGIVKSVKFQKTKLEGQTEAMIERASNHQQNKKVRSNLIFTSRYDATLTLFGNPTFKVGLYVYIDPRSMGIGISSSFKDRIENDLGIGGYYLIYRAKHTIKDGEYTTELSLIQEYGIREILKFRKEDSPKLGN
jgi:hypothetical protein